MKIQLVHILLALLLLCAWLSVMTYYAVSSIDAAKRMHPALARAEEGEGGNTGNRDKANKDGDRVSQPSGGRAPTVPPLSAQASSATRGKTPQSALEEIQLVLLKRRVAELEERLSQADSVCQNKVRLLQDSIDALHAAAAANAAAASSRPRHRPPPPNPLSSGGEVGEGHGGLDPYEEEQRRVRSYQKQERAKVLEEQRKVARQSRQAAATTSYDALVPRNVVPRGVPSTPPPQLRDTDHTFDNGDEDAAHRRQEPIAVLEGLPDGGGVADYEPPSVGLSRASREHLDALSRSHGPTIPVVVVAYRRVKELKKCVDTILRRMPHVGFQLFASQDSWQFPDVTDLLKSYERDGKLVHLAHQRNVSGGTEEEYANGWEPYFAISHHYHFILSEIFSVPSYDRVILVEEDIEVSVDFFEYMAATSVMLERDPTLYCVSAWNDNGKASLVADPRTLYRTDFFPGLGWMLSRSLWNELKPKWPAGFWDDWLRQPRNRKGRSCIRPEVPRTFTWCTEDSVSQGQFCSEHMANIKLADTAINWIAQDLSYLVKDSYDKWLTDILQSAVEITRPDELERVHVPPGNNAAARGYSGELNKPLQEVVLKYHSNEEFEHLAQLFNLMDDFKDNVPRTAYRGVVSFRHREMRVHLVAAVPLYDY